MTEALLPPTVVSHWQRAYQMLSCQQHSPEIRYKVDSLERMYYYKQCTVCGEKLSNMLKHNLVKNPKHIKPFDEQLAKTHIQKIKDLAQLIKDSEQQSFWDSYNFYLKSDKWKIKREAVLKRDNYTCQACLVRRATECHHLTYDHLGDEPLFDLIAVCKQCHDKITQMDRKLRGNSNGR